MGEAISLRCRLFYHFFQLCEGWFLNYIGFNFIKYAFISLISNPAVLIAFLSSISMGNAFWIMILVMVLMTRIHHSFSLILILTLIMSFIFFCDADLWCLSVIGFLFELLLIIILLRLWLFLLNILCFFLRLWLGLKMLWYYDCFCIHIFLLDPISHVRRGYNYLFIRVIFIFNYNLLIFLASRQHQLPGLLLLFR